MDLSSARPPAPPEIASRRFVRAAPVPEGGEPRRAPPEAAPTRDRGARSLLKFSLSAADVDARFEIHEATSRVTVTMYERQTGEVLREVPSKHVLDVIAAVIESGLNVDTAS